MGMIITSVDVTTYSISFAVEGRYRGCVDFFAADDDSSSSDSINNGGLSFFSSSDEHQQRRMFNE